MWNQIANHTFRANPAWSLIPCDHLTEAEQADLHGLRNDPDFYGVLVNGSRIKSTDPDTALLLLTLREPGVLPRYLHNRLGRKLAPEIARLVCDDVLQIAGDGQFHSGPAALALLQQERPGQAEEAPAHPLALLSHQALQYAARLPRLPHHALAQRLYLYNTLPITPRRRQQLPDHTAVAAWLGANGGWMAQNWHRAEGSHAQGWLVWQHRHARRGPLPFKLYISPHPRALPDLFRPIVKTLARHRVTSFKVGRDAAGILRPDKMVAYLGDFEHLTATARSLEAVLADHPAQGVPFTAPIDPHGALSWGMDPPETAHTLPGEQRESWRFWVVQQLATALLDAASQAATTPNDSPVPAWQYALDRLALEGIDTRRWILRHSLWE